MIENKDRLYKILETAENVTRTRSIEAALSRGTLSSQPRLCCRIKVGIVTTDSLVDVPVFRSVFGSKELQRDRDSKSSSRDLLLPRYGG